MHTRTLTAALLALGLAAAPAFAADAVMTGEQAKQAADQLATVEAGQAKGKRDAQLEPVALFAGPSMPTGIAVSKTGRIFASFPRWSDPVAVTLGEVRDGQLVPFPSAEMNRFLPDAPDRLPADRHLVSVQAVYFDARDRLWVVDTGSISLAPVIEGGPKLLCFDLADPARPVKTVSFPPDVVNKRSYLNDVRVDLNRGPEGTAYLTDSGEGGIVVVDLATGTSWRRLVFHDSTQPVPGLQLTSEGRPFLMRLPTREVRAPAIASDGIALSPDGRTLYYTPLVGRDVYSVSTDALADRDGTDAAVAQTVRTVATKPSANDGIECDAQGRIYTTDWEDNAIRRLDPTTGEATVLTQDERLIWPDGLAIHDGQLYVMTNQLARQPMFHFGKDQRKPPYVLFRLPIDGQAIQGREQASRAQ